jgi:hypothetical protein
VRGRAFVNHLSLFEIYAEIPRGNIEVILI